MKNIYLIIILTSMFYACSDDGTESGGNFQEQIIGGWQLELIRVEGADCQAIFGADVPEMYLADEEGCARPNEIQGNARRCINIILNEDGTGFFVWSEITGQQDAAITYTITNNEMTYCADNNSICGGSYKLVGGKLESTTELRFDQTCRAIYVLKRK